MTKIFRGVTSAARPPSRVWSIKKLIFRFSIIIIKSWSGPHLHGYLHILGRWPATVTTMTATCSTSATSTLGLSGWWLIFTAAVTGGLDVRNPHVLELADSVKSEFFAPVGNTLITSRERENLVRICSENSFRRLA